MIDRLDEAGAAHRKRAHRHGGDAARVERQRWRQHRRVPVPVRGRHVQHHGRRAGAGGRVFVFEPAEGLDLDIAAREGHIVVDIRHLRLQGDRLAEGRSRIGAVGVGQDGLDPGRIDRDRPGHGRGRAEVGTARLAGRDAAGTSRQDMDCRRAVPVVGDRADGVGVAGQTRGQSRTGERADGEVRIGKDLRARRAEHERLAGAADGEGAGAGARQHVVGIGNRHRDRVGVGIGGRGRGVIGRAGSGVVDAGGNTRGRDRDRGRVRVAVVDGRTADGDRDRRRVDGERSGVDRIAGEGIVRGIRQRRGGRVGSRVGRAGRRVVAGRGRHVGQDHH